jgi:hypothetical protein
MKVKIVAYKGYLVLVPNNPADGIGKPEGWYPTGDDRMGCVILDTKSRLGVSEEAFNLMKNIKTNHDDFGDISWWECDDGTWAFSWFGSIHRIINPATAEGDREFRIINLMKEVCTIIPNDVPEEAKRAIDHPLALDGQVYHYKEPHRLDGVILQGHEGEDEDDVAVDDDHCDCGNEHCD